MIFDKTITRYVSKRFIWNMLGVFGTCRRPYFPRRYG